MDFCAVGARTVILIATHSRYINLPTIRNTNNIVLQEFRACRNLLVKCKGLPQQAEVTQGVPDRLTPRIFLTFGTTRVVGRQPYALTAFTPGEIPGTHFQKMSRPQGTWFCR